MKDRFKFRVWDNTRKCYLKDENVAIVGDGDLIYGNTNNPIQLAYGADNPNIIVEQSTGLRDKNGNLIYEGDIIETERFVYLVGTRKVKYIVKFGEYHQDGSGGEYEPTRCLGFYADNGCNKYDSTTSIQSLFDDSPIEIIGNIHQNKGLLK